MSRRFQAVIVAVSFLALAMAASVIAATDAPAKYAPSEVESLRLQVAQDEAKLAQKDAQAAEAAFQAKLTALMSAADAVKKAHGWPLDTQFNPGFADAASAFSDPPKPAPTAPTPTPAPKEK